MSTAEAWLQFADRVNAEILSDEWSTKGRLHAVLLARVCAEWWPVDMVRARPRCAQAIDEVSHAEQGETAKERKQRVEFARVVLGIVGALDAAMRRQLVEMLSKTPGTVDPAGRKSDKASAAEILASAAGEDKLPPVRIAELVSDAIALAPLGDVLRPLQTLRETNPQQADDLFFRAIHAATASSDYYVTMSWLPNDLGENSDLPEAWRQAILALFYERLVLNTGDQDAVSENCSFSGNVQPWLNQYIEPKKSQLLAAIAKCISSGTPQGIVNPEDLLPRDDEASVDEYLRSAANEKEARIRGGIKVNAAFRADKDGDYEKAIAIIDGLSKEEREALNSSWGVKSVRRGFVLHKLQTLLQQHDIKTALAVIDAQPVSEQLEFDFQSSLQLDRTKQQAELAALGRHALSVVHNRADNPIFYVDLVNLVFRADPEHALDAMRQAIKELDRWEPVENGEPGVRDTYWYTQRLTKLYPLHFGAEMREIDPESLDAIGRELHNDTVRITFRLSLLHVCLGRYVELNQQNKHSTRN